MRHPIFQTISEVLVYALLIIVLIVNSFGLVLSLQQQSTVAKNSKIRTQQIQSLQDHIDCLAKFFNQPDRAGLKVTQLSDCEQVLDGAGGAK